MREKEEVSNYSSHFYIKVTNSTLFPCLFRLSLVRTSFSKIHHWRRQDFATHFSFHNFFQQCNIFSCFLSLMRKIHRFWRHKLHIFIFDQFFNFIIRKLCFSIFIYILSQLKSFMAFLIIIYIYIYRHEKFYY